MSLLDWLQQRQIARNQGRIDRTSRQLDEYRRALADLEAELLDVKRRLLTLQLFVRDRLSVSESDFAAELGRLIAQVEPEQRRSVKCRECGRLSSKRHVKCVYCDAPLPRILP
jgi:hypothetical protein